MEYHFKIHKDSDGFWAECIELDGCVTQADSMSKLEDNMAEVLSLFLDEPADSKVVFPLPKRGVSGRSVRKVPVPPNIAFAFLMRRHRLQKGLTQKEASKRLGFKNLYSYQRLESGKTANPELSTLQRVRNIFPDFSVDQILGEAGRAAPEHGRSRSLAHNSR